MAKKRTLFLCLHNSCRSQMAEGLLRRLAADRFEVYSAGLDPGAVRPEAIAVMAELGIDISQHRSKSVDEFEGQEFEYAITVSDSMNEGWPLFPGRARYLHWSFRDPAEMNGSDEQRIAAFRQSRDTIAKRIEAFVTEQCGLMRVANT